MPGILAEQRVERVEVAGGRAFADRDLAAGRELVERFFLGEALVIGRDAGGDVSGRLLAAQPRRVAVHRLAAVVRRLHFRQARRIAVQDAGEVHHLAEIANPRIVEQLLDLGDRDLGAGRFERRRRHARRRTEVELERHLRRVLEHVPHARHAQHVADLVRIAHRGHGAVHDRRPGELARHEHRAFDVHVGVDEPGQQISSRPRRRFRDSSDPAILDDDLRRDTSGGPRYQRRLPVNCEIASHGMSFDSRYWVL